MSYFSDVNNLLQFLLCLNIVGVVLTLIAVALKDENDTFGAVLMTLIRVGMIAWIWNLLPQ